MSTAQTVNVDGRLQASICVEQAAARANYPMLGLWSVIDGGPYKSLGQVATVEMVVPRLFKHDCDAAVAAKLEARRLQEAVIEEQHAAAIRVFSAHLSRASSLRVQTAAKSKTHAGHLQSKAIQADDAWLAQLDVAEQSLLIKKQPARLTTDERAESRFPQMALALSEERHIRCRSRTQHHSSSAAQALSQDARSWGGRSAGPAGLSRSHSPTAGMPAVQLEAAESGQLAQISTVTAETLERQPTDAEGCQPCSLGLAEAPTFSQHDYDLLAMVPTSEPSKQPCQQPLPTAVGSSTAAMAKVRTPVPRNASMTMRARTRKGPALASYLSAHARSRTNMVSPVLYGVRSATACSMYTAARSLSPTTERHDSHTDTQGSTSGSDAAASCSAALASSEPPMFEDLVKPPRQAAGQTTPALRCQRSWLVGRQQQRHSLQGSLWERAQRRSHAVAQPAVAAACTQLLMRELEHSSGRRPAYCIQDSRQLFLNNASILDQISGVAPTSIAEAAEQMLLDQQQRPPPAIPPLELAPADRKEVNRIAQFYSTLCAMVQKDRDVDLFSMALLLQVKHELESGVGMKPQLVTRSLRELTQLAADTGVLHQRAAQLLSLVTFMRKAVGMSEDLLQHHVRFLGAMQLLYSPQQLDAIAAQGKPAPRPTPPVDSKKSSWPAVSRLRDSSSLKLAPHSSIGRAASVLHLCKSLNAQNSCKALQQTQLPKGQDNSVHHSALLSHTLPQLA